MSITSEQDESSVSYSPSLIEMVTSFVKSNKQESEVRARKSLVILEAKDLQLQQLQDRISFLEDLSNGKDEIVPKLQLPRSSSLCQMENVVDEDLEGISTLEHESKQALRLPEHFLDMSPENLRKHEDDCSMREFNEQIVSACHDRWQNVVDQLEIYNKQLEAELKEESQLRLKDKQIYCSALVGVSEALRNVKIAMEEAKIRGCHNAGDNILSTRGPDFKQISNKASKSLHSHKLPHESVLTHGHSQTSPMPDCKTFNKEEIFNRLMEAKRIITELHKHIQQVEKRYRKECNLRKNLEIVLAKYHRLTGSSVGGSTVMSPFRLEKRKSYCVTKRKTEHKIKLQKIKQKYIQLHYESEKKKESIRILEADLSKAKEKCIMLENNEENYKIDLEKKDKVIKELKEKLAKLPTPELMKGKLETATQVMAKQHKQIKQAEQEVQESKKALENLKRRLSRAEILNSKQESLAESFRKQQSEVETKLAADQEKIKSLSCELSKLKDVNFSLHSQNTNLKQQNEDLVKKYNESKTNLTEIKSVMEKKLNTLSGALQRKISESEESQTQLQDKLSQLRAQFVSQMQEASFKIASADTKIQELFGGIELFLKMLLASQPPMSTLSSPQGDEAVSEVCSILNLSPAQMQNIVCSASSSECEKINWLQECYKLIHLEEFSEKLGHLLFDVVHRIKKN